MARHLPAALLLAALLAAAAAGAASLSAPPRVFAEGPVWRLRDGALLYRFHAVFREERLFDAAADPYETKDLSGARPDDLSRLRALFLGRLGVPSLERVPKTGREWLDMIPGYIPSIRREGR